jgi:hypothetical protein
MLGALSLGQFGSAFAIWAPEGIGFAVGAVTVPVISAAKLTTPNSAIAPTSFFICILLMVENFD